MARLAKDTRSRMANALVKFRFESEAQLLVAESAALFETVYVDLYSAAIRSHIAEIIKFAPNAFKRVDQMQINVRGMSIDLGSDYRIGVYEIARWDVPTTEKPVIPGINDGSYLDGPLADRLANFAMALQAFNAKLTPAKNEAQAVLAQFSSVKKLQDEWPEALPVIGHLIPSDERTLPVVQLDTINDHFGLPPQ